MQTVEIRELEKSVQNIITDYRTTQHIAAQDLNHFAEILMDHFLFYRFHKKFGDKTLEMLQRHIDWRIQHLLSSLSPEMLLPEARVLFEDGLFRFHKQDVHSRPVLYLTPRIYDPNTFDLNHLQQALFLCLETMRRWLMSLEQPTFTVVVDLKGFGLSQLGYDLIPFLYETFQRHYPQIVGQAIVLNYGWVHAGLWSVVRQSLTPEARERLVFIDQDKMSQYIPAESIPTMYGGQDPDFPVHPKVCPILNTFGQTDNPLTQTMEYEHLLNQLMPVGSVPMESVGSNSIYFDPPTIDDDTPSPRRSVRPQKVKSAADLQNLLEEKGMRRLPSRKSFTSLQQLGMTALDTKLVSSPLREEKKIPKKQEPEPSFLVFLLESISRLGSLPRLWKQYHIQTRYIVLLIAVIVFRSIKRHQLVTNSS